MKRMNPKTDGVMEDYAPDDAEEIGLRIIEVGGINYRLQFKDPYGFCVIRAEKGRTPDELSGQYTMQSLAEAAIRTYHAKKEVAA